MLWSFDEIAKNNSDIEIESYASGFIAFGGDGGGELLAFDGLGAIFMLPMIGMDSDCAIRVAENFQELLNRMDLRPLGYTHLQSPLTQPQKIVYIQ